MTKIPQFISISPKVMDERRIAVTIKTENLPEVSRIGACMVNFADAATPNVSLDLNAPLPKPIVEPPKSNGNTDIESNIADTAITENDENPFAHSKFPVVELNLVDENNESVAQVMIIEHQEPELEVTMHLREPLLGHVYTVYAEMIYQTNSVHVMNQPFVLATSA